MEQYAIYLRKSRADIEAEKLGEGETLARHRKILTELAARRQLFIGEIYQEIVSGETISARPEIQRLIQDCYVGKWAGVLVVEISRLSRGNQGDAQIILDCLRYSNRNNGVLVVTPTKVYDVAHNTDDEEFMEFELFMSRREYKMIKRRMDRGREHAVVEGNYMGAYRPYGYDILKTKNSRTLIPNEDEAPIVKSIFDWATKEKLSSGKIAERLCSMNVPTYRGGKEWNRSSVKTILTNPVYIGKVRWNDRMQVKKMLDGELTTSRPRSNHGEKYMEFDGKHKKFALVDEETFHAASEKFYCDRTKSNLRLSNPLAGLFFCQNCGFSMVYQSFKSKPNVSPRYLHRESSSCKVKSVLATDVWNAVSHALELYIKDFELRIDNSSNSDENAILEQIESLEKRVKQARKKLSKAFDDYEDGIYSAAEFLERKEKHNRDIEDMNRQILNLENSIPEKEAYEEKIIQFSGTLGFLSNQNVDADVKNAYLKSILNRIEFSREPNAPDEFILDVYIK